MMVIVMGMYSVLRAVLGALALTTLLVSVFYIEGSTMIIEYYVYEITTSTGALVTRFTVKLVRLDNETFKVELLQAEPEGMRIQLETRFNPVNWTLKLVEIPNTSHYFLYLPEASFQPYIDIELIRVGCEKAYEIEKVVKDYINPRASSEQRLKLVHLLRSPSIEVYVISMLVGDLYNAVGLRAYTLGFRDAYYKLTAMCEGSVYTFSYTYSFQYEYSGCEHVLEATSRYSTTGWLVSAKFTHKETCKTGGEATTRLFAVEQKLVETSNEDLKTHAFPTQPPGLQELGEFLANPVTILIAVAVVAVVVAFSKLARARK